MRERFPTAALVGLAAALCAACGDSDGAQTIMQVDPPDGGGAPNLCAATAEPCADEGATRCEGDGVRACLDTGGGCLAWGFVSACPEGQACAAGACESACSGQDDCGAVGLRACDGGGVKVCGPGLDGCLTWSAVEVCPAGTACSLGSCTTMGCVDECIAQGATQCDAGGVANCGEFDGDPCREWSQPQPCPAGTTCSAGSCAATCENECTSLGARACDDVGQRVRECGQHDSDACLEWAVVQQCASDETCSLGACSTMCVDECVLNETRCRPGSATTIERCRDADADPCVEWAADVDCADSGAVCSDGMCAANCVFDCQVSGQTACDGDGVKTCGDFDADPCLDWGTSVPCAAFETCEQGACAQVAAPFAAVVSEVLYNAPGQDHDVFIELTGAAAGDLAGFSLVAINGADGAVYAEIPLQGALDSEGRFVIAHPLAAAWIADVADQTTPLADLQNGPDNLQLRFGAVTVDALGYGDFGAGDSFAGEGSPAPEAAIGQALSRDVNATDTDDNSVDFAAALTPTPGAAAIVAIPPDAPGDVVISEVMADPTAVSDASGEWVELYNPYSDVAFELQGCRLSKTGNGGHVIGASLLVPPEGVVVLARSDAAGFDADYVFGGVDVTNGSGGLVLSCGDIEVDAVTWASAPSGASLSLDVDHLDAVANDDASNWCQGQSDYNGGDLGSPGALNPPCPAAGSYDQTLHDTTWGVCNPTANWNPITFTGTQVAASDAAMTLQWWAPYCDGYDGSELLVEVFSGGAWVQVGSALASGATSSCTWLDAGVGLPAATLNAARDPSGAVQARFRIAAGCPAGVGCGTAAEPQPYSCARRMRLTYSH